MMQMQIPGSGGGGQQFYDRGDPAAADWTQATLTEDNTWRDLDLSSIIPAGTAMVLFRVAIQDGGIGNTFMLRKNGLTNDVNAARMRVIVTGQKAWFDVLVAPDSSRVVEYLGQDTFDVISLTVAGWWA